MKNKYGWEKSTLGEVSKFENGDRGFNYPSKSDRTDVGIPFVNAGHLSSNGIDTENMDYISREKFNQLGGGKFKIGDLLFCLRGSVGKYAMNKQFTEGTIASSLVIIRPNSNLIGQFLMYYFESRICKEMIADFGNGAAQPNLSAGNLKKFKILLPPVIEQHQIVSELDTLSDIINKKKQQLEKLDKLAQATFYDMFGDPVTNEKGWDFKKMGDFVTFLNGRAYKQNELLDEGKYTVLRVGNFFSNRGYYYSDLELDDDKYCDNDDLLYAWSASFGPHIWKGNKVIYHYHIWKVVINEQRTDKGFIFSLLKYITEYLKEGTHGIAMMHLTKSGMEGTKVILPPLSLQTKFATKIESIENQKALINQSVGDVQQLFDYTMDKYFNF